MDPEPLHPRDIELLDTLFPSSLNPFERAEYLEEVREPVTVGIESKERGRLDQGRVGFLAAADQAVRGEEVWRRVTNGAPIA